MSDTQGSSAERLAYFGRKCDQHLVRIRLSHLLATSSTRFPHADAPVQELRQAAFDNVESDDHDAKLRRGLHEVHLIALKADFELFLSRLLTTLWTTHFGVLVTRPRKTYRVSLGDVAKAIAAEGPTREAVIEAIVPAHGLATLVASFKEAIELSIPEHLVDLQRSDWSQIEMAFEVRHLVEHRDGKADAGFLKRVGPFWTKTSWGEARALQERGQRVVVESVDVERTCDAMRRAARLITDAAVQWDRQYGLDPTPTTSP